jgi:hypothetical protein
MLTLQLYERFRGGETPPKELGASRDYNVDMVPKFMMANGKLVKVRSPPLPPAAPGLPARTLAGPGPACASAPARATQHPPSSWRRRPALLHFVLPSSHPTRPAPAAPHRPRC